MPFSIKTRFAPSPTGVMHLGNVRTALFNWLFTQSQSGTFLLRIEDTDLERSKQEYTDGILRDLKWLGLTWQEGPEAGGKNGPYFQSARQKIYDQYYDHLLEQNLAYPCFCSEEQLIRSRNLQRAAGKPPRYTGTCRHLTKEQIEEKIKQGLKPVLRFKIPEGETEFDDLVRGVQKFQNNDIGDFIIRRANGSSPFMFCSCIDDALMGVTHILRGEDHLTNTPRQIMILQALKLFVPHYGHITLIVGHDGSPLSKRHGSLSIHDLREQGYLAEAIINYLARLGHHYENDALMSSAELAENFKLENLNKSPARFDMQQLNYWQKEAVHSLTINDAEIWLSDVLKKFVPENRKELFLNTVLPNIRFPLEAMHWAEIIFTDKLFSLKDDDQKKISLQFLEMLKNNLTQDYQTLIQTLKTQLNLKGKDLFEPLRLVFTGEEHGPELKQILELMPNDIKRKRIENQ
ncbi:MAG: glutamate--tRNA ligase [Gammaproteobacteria bacterium RIFOXYB2_FULL_38_6]|nr:MAG: glutamate--tRNA ligase [Gammaproteobacteria bacterium RIFOXYB2_FULL_38_6]